MVDALRRRSRRRCRDSGKCRCSGPCLAGIQQLGRRGEGLSQASGQGPQQADRSSSDQLGSP